MRDLADHRPGGRRAPGRSLDRAALGHPHYSPRSADAAGRALRSRTLAYHAQVARRGRGEGTVYSHGDYWRASVSLGVTPNGRRVRKEFQARTRPEAARKLRQALERVRGGVPLGGSLTVAAYAASWLADIAPTVKGSTFAFYRAIVDNHLEEIEPVPLPALTPEHVRALIAARFAEGYSSRTVRGVVQTLALILRRALVDGYVTRNVAALVKLPRLEQKEPGHFTVAEARRFLAAASADPLGGLYTVALGTGLRRGELLALTWQDVDLAAGTLRVRRGKTAAAARSIPLPDFALDALGAIPRGVGPIWQASPSHVSDHFRRLCQKARVPVLTMHSLRHTAATLLLAEGVDPLVIASILGHSRVAMTTHYAHVLPELQREAVARLGRALG